MIKVDENDPVGELEPSFPYRDVVIKRNVDMKQFYELETEIGRGKFGTVYRCREKSTGLQLAAKFVGMGRRQERRNVEREVDIMRTLQHPRLIQLYDAFEISNVMCVIQELIEGGELFERVIDDDFILTEKACTVFVRQICEAVEFIHSQYILHLDLKPENILCLTRTGNRIKIIDFGLARKFEPDKKLQVLFGTPEFVAPEVVNFDQIGFGTDMWSVGVICYVLLSGLSPFMGETDVETMANVTIAQYDFDDDAFDNISEDAKDFISKLLTKNREQRLSASECLLHSWLRRKPPPPRTQPQPPARRISEGLDSAKENLREFVDRWSQHSSSPQMIEIINAGRKDSLDQSISAEKMKILNEENFDQRNNVGNNSVTLMNSTNKQEGLPSRNASTDNIKTTQHDQSKSQNIVGSVTLESIFPKNENLRSPGVDNKVLENNRLATNEATDRSKEMIEDKSGVDGMSLVANDVMQVVNPPSNVNLKLDIEAAKKVSSIETSLPKLDTSPVKIDNGTAKVTSPLVAKSGTIPKTPSGTNLKFDPVPSPNSPKGQPLSPGLKKDISTDKVKDVIGGVGAVQNGNSSLGGIIENKCFTSGENVSKQSENSGEPPVISQTQLPSSTSVPQSLKQEFPQSPAIVQQVPQAPFKSVTSSSPAQCNQILGVQATSNQPKPMPTSSITQITAPSKFGSIPSTDIKPSVGIQPSTQSKTTSSPTTGTPMFGSLSSTDIKSCSGSQPKTTPVSGIQTSTQSKTTPPNTPKFGSLQSTDIKSSESQTQSQPKTTTVSGIQASTQLKTTSSTTPKFGHFPSTEIKSSESQIPSQPKTIPVSGIQTFTQPKTTPSTTPKFGSIPSTDIKSSAGTQNPSQQKLPPSALTHGVAQSKFGNLSSSDLKTSSESKTQSLEQSSNVFQNKPSLSSTSNKPTTSTSSGSGSQIHPKFFFSNDSPSTEECDTMENDSVPSELKNVVHEMRHISVHKPKMTSQLSEPDLTKCTLQRNIPEKKFSTRGAVAVAQDSSKSNSFRNQKDSLTDSRMSKLTMKHVPPKIHGIVLGQNQTEDEAKVGPKVIMHKIHMEGRSEPLIPTSKENTSKPQKPITKSQTLSKLELNETTDKVKRPSICNLVAKDRFDMRRGSDISCFLHNTENMESPSLSEEIKKLSSRLFQKGKDDDFARSASHLMGHSSLKNDPIGRFMANHGVITKRPKYRLSNLNRDVPLGSPPPSSNIFYHLSHSDSFSDPHTTHSAPQSPSESPERELASRHSGLTRDVILSLFGDKKPSVSSENEDNLSATSTIDSLASYFNRANSKNISSFFNNK